MATIRARKLADGSVRYTAQIRIKRDGVQVYQESQTFARKQATQTAGNDLAHLGAVLSIGKDVWGYQVDPLAMGGARRVLRKLGYNLKSRERLGALGWTSSGRS